MPTVQRWRGLAATGLTLLALGLVLGVLTAPARLDEMSPSAFLRLPVELVVLVALVLALPDRSRRVRGVVVATSGLLLGVLAVFKVLDLAFGEALNRPFDQMIDWRYASDLVGSVRGSSPGVRISKDSRQGARPEDSRRHHQATRSRRRPWMRCGSGSTTRPPTARSHSTSRSCLRRVPKGA